MTEHSFESGTQTFVTDVLEASRRVPVVVDFWAPWCGPCRALTPVLEKLAQEYGGQFLLAKINTDEHPEIAAEYGVRGIPNVKAFVDGGMVSEFTGALPEAGVRQFLERILPGPSERARRAAAASLGEGDFDAAEQQLREALRLDERNDAARIDLAELLVARQAFEEAEGLLGELLPIHRDARVEQIEARIGVWRKSQSLPDATALQAELDAHPENLEARLAYAERLVVEGRYAQALDAFLQVVQGGRGELRERARQGMLQVFNLDVGDSALISDYRRRLASALH
ncbi:MAG TPA: tetratricopeptide repeat protein [Burkholderiales bacterium]|nr:tetratricopeptide repeat protein [Burkholderiales bacterium]